MATPNALLVIIRHAPHNSSWLREGLDAALVAAAFGQPVHLLFLGQGILALLKSMHLTTDALVEGVTLLAEQQVPGLLQQHSNILNF